MSSDTGGNQHFDVFGIGVPREKAFYSLTEQAMPMLRKWIHDRDAMARRRIALELICREANLDPDTTTVKQIMDLE